MSLTRVEFMPGQIVQCRATGQFGCTTICGIVVGVARTGSMASVFVNFDRNDFNDDQMNCRELYARTLANCLVSLEEPSES